MTPVTKILFAVALAWPAAVQAEAPVTTSWGTIAEPAYPAHICATLPAGLTARVGSIDAYDADGRDTHPDQVRLQAAIDGCTGGAVKLVAGPEGEDAFLSGPLTLKSGVVLWIDRGVTLFASRDPADYDKGAGDCGTANMSTVKSCRSLIEGRDLVDSGLVGDGTIDGRGGSLLLSGPNAGKRSWWDVAWQTKQGLTQHNFRLVQIDGGRNFTLLRLTFENSPNFHIVPNDVDGITAWGIKILTPSPVYAPPGYACMDGTTPDVRTPAVCFTPETVKNTDGFDPGNSRHVLLAYSYISTGDDNVAIKAGQGALSQHQAYVHNHFYYGHGMSIGSETDGGVDDIVVSDLVLDGMDSPGGNGLRIKSDPSRGGKVTGVVFENVCMRNEVRPMVFDTAYSDKTGVLYPDFADVTVRNFHYVGSAKYGGGTLVFRGYPGRPIGLKLETVVFDGPQPVVTGGKGKDRPFGVHFTVMPGATGFAALLTPSVADDVTVEYQETRSSPGLRDCSGAFEPFVDTGEN